LKRGRKGRVQPPLSFCHSRKGEKKKKKKKGRRSTGPREKKRKKKVATSASARSAGEWKEDTRCSSGKEAIRGRFSQGRRTSRRGKKKKCRNIPLMEKKKEKRRGSRFCREKRGGVDSS